MPDQHGVARELQQRRQHGLDPRRRRHQRVGEAGEHGDHRWDRPARVDEGLERAEALAATDLDGPDLGDGVAGPVATRRLQVEHAERDVGQRRAEVVEAALHWRPNRRCHDWHETTNTRSCQTPVRSVLLSMATEMPEHGYLRSAVEFAVALAQRTKAPDTFPAALKPFVRQPQRIPTAALGKLRRAIDADPEFRRRVADGAVPDVVDEIGIEWLRHEDGWEDRVATLVAADKEASIRARDESAVRRAERRREAAEQAAVRARAELVALQDRLDAATAQIAAERAEAAVAATAAQQARAQLAEARLAAAPCQRPGGGGAEEGGRPAVRARHSDGASRRGRAPARPPARRPRRAQRGSGHGHAGRRVARAGRIGAPAGRPPRRARRCRPDSAGATLPAGWRRSRLAPGGGVPDAGDRCARPRRRLQRRQAGLAGRGRRRRAPAVHRSLRGPRPSPR